MASGWWAPRRRPWWIAVLFAIGSTCFFVGPFPGLVQLVGSLVDASIFFVGSLFFTTAAALQCLETWHSERRGDRWSSLIQFAGTLAFNVTTFRALQVGFDDVEYDRLVWAPDAVGSVCFLVSGAIAYLLEGGGRWWPAARSEAWRIAAVNFLGCILFGASAVASFVVPTHGSELDLAGANVTTALGGLCFLVGSLLLLPIRPAGDDSGGRDVGVAAEDVVGVEPPLDRA